MQKKGTQKSSATPELAWVSKRDLVVNMAYQREVSLDSVARLAKNFDMRKLGAIQVSGPNKDGTYFVIDGWHRTQAALLLDYIDLIPCVIVQAHTVGEQAEIFKGINSGRRYLEPYIKYRAGLIAGDAICLLVMQTLEKNGYRVTSSGKRSRDVEPGTIRCVGNLMHHAFNAPAQFEWTIETLSTIADGAFISAPLYSCVRRLFEAMRADGVPDAKVRNSISILAGYGAHGCESAISRAKSVCNGPSATIGAMGLLGLINKGKRLTVSLSSLATG